MNFDLDLFSNKLNKYRLQFDETIDDVSSNIGIQKERLIDFEEGLAEPTGDEILILADYYDIDYKFFLSNEKVAPFEQTEILFRKHGKEISKQDRWTIQEFLYQCECEEYLLGKLSQIYRIQKFDFIKQGTNYKQNGILAARELRKHLKYSFNEGIKDVYNDFRRIHFHIFRKKLLNSNISGLFIKHPTAGNCILINYNEDIYRQRFSVAHEVAHAILDDIKDINVSYTKYDNPELSEIGANAFASEFLIPTELITKVLKTEKWTIEKGKYWAKKLKVSTSALAVALIKNKIIDQKKFCLLRDNPVKKSDKVDPELTGGLSPNTIKRKKTALELGLSTFYIDRCFEAYENKIITFGRLSEMLRLKETMIFKLAKLFGRRFGK